jgi:hypothetical protein
VIEIHSKCIFNINNINLFILEFIKKLNLFINKNKKWKQGQEKHLKIIKY